MGNKKSSIIPITKVKKPSRLKRLNKRGFSLIEVMVAFGLVGVLSLFLASVMQNMYKGQKQTALIGTLENMRQNIQKMLQDGRAWRETAADPDVDSTGVTGIPGADPLNMAVTNLRCLAFNTPCNSAVIPAITATTPNSAFADPPFTNMPVLSDASGTRYINSSSPSAGFTSTGAPCNTFVSPPAAGNDDCPIRWELRISYTCPNAAAPTTCISPGVRAFAILTYNPKPGNSMRSVINETRFRVDVIRGPRGENRSERFEAVREAKNPNVGGGICTPGTWNSINFNRVTDNNANPNASLAGGAVQVKTGTYVCSAQATCFACGTLGLRVVNETAGGPPIAVAPSALAPQWVLANASVNNITFVVNSTSNLRLWQYCDASPPSPYDIYGMGMTLPDYGNFTIFSSLICTRIF